MCAATRTYESYSVSLINTVNNTPFDETPSAPQRSAAFISPSSIHDSSSPPCPHGDFSSPDEKYYSGEDSVDELDIRNVSAFDEWDVDDADYANGNQGILHTQRNVDDIYRMLSFDEIVYNDDGNDDKYQDELLWSIRLSNRCHKSLRALFLPSPSSTEERSLTSSQATKVASNKTQTEMLPNIRQLSLSPTADTVTGATVESSVNTKNIDKSIGSNSSSSWISLWCCGMSQGHSDDSLSGIQRRLFSSTTSAPPIPDFVVIKKESRDWSDILLEHLDKDEEKSTSITVFEDDDSIWNM